ncbi:MAG: cysteine desulfurase [Bacteroidales bacterium]|nr:cysteine desulfurase [Bacteroidales bacterium]
MLDIQKLRLDFPILQTKIHGKDLVYFDSAATTQKPQVVIDSIVDYYTKYNSNIHRGIHSLSQLSTQLYEDARETVKQFINAEHNYEIVFTKGLTEAINLVAFSFGETFIKPNDEIIISAMEHHANIVPWQMLCERKQAILKIIPFDNDGVLDLDIYKNLITEKTKLVSVSYISNVLGTKNPIPEIIKFAHLHNVPVLIDGAQSVQHEKIDVQKLDCDFFTIAGHKAYGPNGTGVLYGKEKWLDKMVPYQGGGDMIKTVTLQKTEYNTLPFKFEAGTTDYVGAHALATAFKYIESIGAELIGNHEKQLLSLATEKLSKNEAVTIYGNAPQKSCVLSFLVKGAHPADVGMILDKQGFALRTGTHCAEPIMQYYNIPGTIRMSFGMYNTTDEVLACCEMIDRISKMFQ